MFSGIVETLGLIQSCMVENGCHHLKIKPGIDFHDLKIGDSVSVNGVCLTVTAFTLNSFCVTVVPETLRCTNLGVLTTNSKVNLERSLIASSRNGGHHVQGHVDAVGRIVSIQKDKSDAILVTIECKESILKYIVNKGYITLDGMSITVIQTNENCFTVTFIPHTQAVTIVSQYQVGTAINIEVDVLGKYIEKFMGAYSHAVVA